MLQEDQTYFIRTVTFHWLGVVIDADEEWVRLRDASWVADSGRYADALKDPKVLRELEPAPSIVLVSRAAIVDAVPVNYEPPRDQR